MSNYVLFFNNELHGECGAEGLKALLPSPTYVYSSTTRSWYLHKANQIRPVKPDQVPGPTRMLALVLNC